MLFMLYVLSNPYQYTSNLHGDSLLTVFQLSDKDVTLESINNIAMNFII